MLRKYNAVVAVLICLLFIPLWAQEVAPSSDQPPILIVPQLDGTISAFEVSSGKHLWNFSTGGPLLQSSEPSVSALEVSLFNTIQHEGIQDIYTEAKSILGATPFMSPDGTVYLSQKTSKLFGLDPMTGLAISSNAMRKPNVDGTVLIEELVCRPSLQIVRTEHTLESYNDSSSHYLTMAHVRAFLRDCSGQEVPTPKSKSSSLPLISSTPMGDLQAYFKNGSLMWSFPLSSVPANTIYAMSSNSLHTINPQVPPRLLSHTPHSMHYKGTPYEPPFGALEPGSKALALPAPPPLDQGRKSIWYWIAIIAVCIVAAIWGLVLLRVYRPTLTLPTKDPHASIPRSQSTLRLRAEHEELQKQLSDLKKLQEEQKQLVPLPLPPLPPPSSNVEALSRYRTDFEEKERLGEGGFGTVFRAINKLDGVEYAVKKVCLSIGNKENDRVLREVRHLAQLDHPNIIRYYQSWVEDDEWNDTRDDEDLYDEEDSAMIADDDDDISAKGRRLMTSDDESESGSEKSEDYEGDESKAGGGSASLSSSFSKDLRSNSSPSQGVYMGGEEGSMGEKEGGKRWNGEILGGDCELDITFGGGSEEGGERGGMDVTMERMYGSTSESFLSKRGKGKRKSLKVVAPLPPTRRTILYIQMQYCHQGTLQHWLSRADRKVCPHEAVSIFRQAVRGVAHIHNNRMIHRDLKPANILISADGNVKIGDFGLSTGGVTDGNPGTPMRVLARSHTAGVGSPFYCSPEQISGERYDSKVDIFSLGIILYEMLHVFSTQMERVTFITELRDGRVNDLTSELYPELAQLALHLVKPNPDERPPAREILSHPTITESP